MSFYGLDHRSFADPDYGPPTSHDLDPRNESVSVDPITLSGPEYADRIDGMTHAEMRDELLELREAASFHMTDAAAWKRECERLRAALQTFANIAEYRDLREAMANVLRPHERDGFLAAFVAARAVVAQHETRRAL